MYVYPDGFYKAQYFVCSIENHDRHTLSASSRDVSFIYIAVSHRFS
jgi:hypothetical protein